MGTEQSAFLAIINLAKSPQLLENMTGCLLQVVRFSLGVVVSLSVFCLQQELTTPLLDFFLSNRLYTYHYVVIVNVVLQAKVGCS